MLNVGGRGSAGFSLGISLNTNAWQVTDVVENPNLAPIAVPEFRPRTELLQAGYNMRVGYGPGLLFGKTAVIQVDQDCGFDQFVPRFVVTRLSFMSADGSEIELREKDTEGRILPVTCGNLTPNRGTTFVSADGSAVTFVSDQLIDPGFNIVVAGLSGNLLFADGSQYRIDNSLVTAIRDRNGNLTRFTYDTQQRLTQVMDAINRKVTIAYAVDAGGVYGVHDQIRYKGFGGAERTIRIAQYGKLRQSLRPNSGLRIKTQNELFPDAPNGNLASGSFEFNPQVLSAIWLPNGQQYRFYYNEYAELARIELPTGAAIEYDVRAGTGIVSDNPPLRDFLISRPVVERRTYQPGNLLEGKQRYTYDNNLTDDTTITTMEVLHGNNQTLAKTKHFFHGSPIGSINEFKPYPNWDDGLEYKTIAFNTDGTPLLKTETTYAQRAPVSWWSSYEQEVPGGDLGDEPPNDVRVIKMVMTLLDSNQSSMTTWQYDQYNNITEKAEFDFNGVLQRKTITRYLRNQNGVNYATDPNIHIRRLPVQMSIVDGSTTIKAQTIFEYDNYSVDTFHNPLLARANIAGLAPQYRNTSYTTRGNLTCTRATVLPGGGTIQNCQQYDVAGNLVARVDPLGRKTLLDYSDQFGAPDGNVTSNTPPAELAGQNAFAFATRVTNALGQMTHMQYDYYRSSLVEMSEANNVVSSIVYNDVLDRPTQVDFARNTPQRYQLTTTYQDSTRTITSKADQEVLGDQRMWSDTVYDGFGRVVEVRDHENASSLITVRTQYDTLGRILRTSNPYRPAETPVWTDRGYDGLSRITEVLQPGGARTLTRYVGTEVRVSDPAGKTQTRVLDALGRIIKVIEDPEGESYVTDYEYDALDNVLRVRQGVQARTFGYDSLRRLLSETTPEAGTSTYVYDSNSNLAHKTDARGVISTYTYDALNRLINEGYSDGTPSVMYTYDASNVPYAKGRLARISSNISAQHIDAYDALGHVLTSRQVTEGNTYTLGYTYNLQGQLRTQTYPSGRVIHTSYDPLGRMTHMTGQKGATNTAYAQSFAYAAHIRRYLRNLTGGLIV